MMLINFLDWDWLCSMDLGGGGQGPGRGRFGDGREGHAGEGRELARPHGVLRVVERARAEPLRPEQSSMLAI